MPIAVLICPNPDSETDVSLDAQIDTAKFNDGYQQDSGRGAFNQPRTFSPKWTNMAYSDAQALIGFLENKRGYTPFYYTFPEEPQRLFKCEKFSYKWKSGRLCNISATFVEQGG